MLHEGPKYCSPYLIAYPYDRPDGLVVPRKLLGVGVGVRIPRGSDVLSFFSQKQNLKTEATAESA